MVASTVSSKMIEAMAKKEGFKFVECLTGTILWITSIASTDRLSVSGFKYIGNVALQLDKEGYEVPFGYEEAIGYMVETNIRDKDGVSAAVRVHRILRLAMAMKCLILTVVGSPEGRICWTRDRAAYTRLECFAVSRATVWTVSRFIELHLLLLLWAWSDRFASD